MKILVIHLDNVILCPPTINLVENLVDHKHEVSLITYNARDLCSKVLQERNNFHIIDLGQRINPTNNLTKYFIRLKKRIWIREYLEKHINEFDRIWTTTEITVREIGNVILKSNTKHIMQLMELTDYVPLFGGYKLFKFDIERYAQRAYRVVVPEYMRAHIVKTKWNLKKLPIILPNKPYSICIDEQIISEKTAEIINILKAQKRKIILYQGGFTKDRNFDSFAKAAKVLEEEYVLCLMGKDNDYRKEICDKYPHILYLGFVLPPEHLIIARYANIGILTYHPVQDGFYSELNAVFCAPNKTFEYALCELPMIGTDVPGLKLIFDQYSIGCCIKNDDAESVIDAIRYVENNYTNMKSKCIDYWESVDLIKIVNDILQ